MLTLLIAGALTLVQTAPTSTEVALPSQPAPLHGTLLSPANATAVAVIIPGSGPTDRDGNSPLGVSAGTYRLLAEGLAAEEIATLRIDKRGIGQSAAAMTGEADLRFDAYADDARAWAAEAATRAGKPCAWLIGHSEGSLVALEAVRTPDDKICGVISLSGAGRPAGTVLREQMANVPEALKTEAFAVLTELEAGRTVADFPPQLASLFRPSVQPYLISWLPLDPAALAAAYRGPLFIGQGTTDLQVKMTDAQALSAARPDATFVPFEGVNHALKAAPADTAGNAATYRDPSLPLAPGIVDAVAAFIRAH
jgi:alpha-beta hydrolase superfamily lysophospholipase